MAKEPYRLEENEYKSPTLVYYKEAYMLVPLVKVALGLCLEWRDPKVMTTMKHYNYDRIM
jgi:hypothetical protein